MDLEQLIRLMIGENVAAIIALVVFVLVVWAGTKGKKK